MTSEKLIRSDAEAQSIDDRVAESTLPTEETPLPEAPLPGVERRRDTRYPTSEPAEVEIFPREVVVSAAMILDVSRSGLRLEVKREVPTGACIRVRILKTHLTIFGEVRYCRQVAEAFHVGVLIEEMFSPQEELGKHIDDMDLYLYVMGHGLSVREVIVLKDHLITCEKCQARFAKKEALLHLTSRPKTGTETSGGN